MGRYFDRLLAILNIRYYESIIISRTANKIIGIYKINSNTFPMFFTFIKFIIILFDIMPIYKSLKITTIN